MQKQIRSKQLNIRLTPEGHGILKSKADSSGLSMASYITKLVSHNMHMTLTDIQYKTLERKAELSGMSVTEFIIDAIMNKKVAGFKKSDIADTNKPLKGQMHLIKDHFL